MMFQDNKELLLKALQVSQWVAYFSKNKEKLKVSAKIWATSLFLCKDLQQTIIIKWTLIFKK